MPMSNYPNGFLNGVTIRGLPILNAYPGNVFWVDSNASFAGDGTYTRPFTTITAALTKCTANKGDIIVCKAGHVSTITSAGALALNVAGVALVGTGCGGNRPTINFTTATTASVTISAANISISNFLFTGGIDALSSPITISAADVAISNCEYRDVTGQATDVIVTTAAANRLIIDGYFHNGAAAAGANSAIALVGGDAIDIMNFTLIGNFAVGAIDIRTTATTNLEIHDGYIWTKNSADICIVDTITASTGRIGPNLNFMLTDNAANITLSATGATFHYFDPIYVCNLAGEKAMLINKTASTHA